MELQSGTPKAIFKFRRSNPVQSKAVTHCVAMGGVYLKLFCFLSSDHYVPLTLETLCAQ